MKPGHTSFLPPSRQATSFPDPLHSRARRPVRSARNRVTRERRLPMTTYLAMTCGRCQRPMRVRTQYVGQMVECNHCRHQFRVLTPAVAEGESGTMAAPDRGAVHGEVSELKAALEQVRQQFQQAAARLVDAERHGDERQ